MAGVELIISTLLLKAGVPTPTILPPALPATAPTFWSACRRGNARTQGVQGG
jgi:hypothetical protein